MDQKPSGKTLYDSSKGEIFGKHFLVGFAQGLGGFVVTLVSWAVIYVVIVYLLLPQLQGTIKQFSDLVKMLPGAKTTQTDGPAPSGTTITVPENLLKQIQGNK